jgi:hypothetical protein
MAKFLFLALILGVVLRAGAQQNGKVSGTVVDTAVKTPVGSVTISILDKRDSSLVSFSMTGSDGKFEVSGLPKGEYRLMATHVNYHNKNIFFSITPEKPNAVLGELPFTDKFKSLDEIIVQAEAPPVTVRADTIEYNAGSFKTQPNANVEDLLKKLPGVKVDKDGTVKAQGQKVNRVFVDGKEFFGNDPKMATRNLPADAVDKVQVYDRASDQAQLTGFDDGNSEKAINLKLKKDKKKGLFGKAMAGAGNKGRYEGRFNINSFKGARQLSVLGMGNNTNAEGFSFMDMLNFSGDVSRMSQGGNISVNITSDDPNAAAMGMAGGRNNSINTTWAGGANYNDLIGTNLDLRSNYFYSRYNPRSETELNRQYFLPDSSYYYRQKGINDRITNSHRLNLILDYAIDSFHSIRLSPSLGYQQSQHLSTSIYATETEDGQLTNDGFNNQRINNSGYNFRNDLLFRKKFRRKGRTFSFAFQNLLNQSDGNGRQESVNRFYNSNGGVSRTDSINQYSLNESDLNGYTARAVYAEPVLKRALLEFSVSNSVTTSNAGRETYDYNEGSGKFDQLNDLLSNDFNNRYGYTNAGIRFRKQFKKFSWSAGTAWQKAALEGKTTGTTIDSTIKKEFYNFLPNARLQYHINRFSSITLNYMSMTSQPTITQLQPVPDISNPLSIVLGNPDLKQEFTNMVQLNLMKVNPVTQKNLFAFLTLRQTYNRIVNSDSINSQGVKFTRPVNADGVYSLNSNLNYGFPLKFMKRSSVNIGTQVNWSRGKQYINQAENIINDLRLIPELRFEMNPTEKLNASLSFSTIFTSTKYTLQSALSTRYFTHEIGADISWELPLNFFFNTDFNYAINAKRADGYNVNVPLWNAGISKFFMKYNRAQVGVRIFDILNQNIGITRTSNNNFIEDRKVTVLKRFFMLSFTYSLSKSGLNAGGGGNMRVITR